MPSDVIDQDLALLDHRVEVERDLFSRSFIDFYRAAWPIMDPEPYVDGKHIRVICHHLQLAARREIQRLLITIPPRHAKSLMCSVAFPAWVWTWWPAAKFITASYDQKLATRDSLAHRRLVESPWYRERWPDVRLQRDQHQKMHYQTTVGGVRYVGSPTSGVTGHGSDFNLFDDPHNIASGESEADRTMARIFWFESMSSRFNNPARGVSIVIQQRVHENDVAGECIRRNYYTVMLPARFESGHPQRHKYDWRTAEGEPLWPEKFNDQVLKVLWETLGGDESYAVAGQQQQRPRPREGGLFKRQWFRFIENIPDGVVWVRAWDLASTDAMTSTDPDWTAGVKLGYHAATRTYIIGNVVRARLNPGGVIALIRATAQADGRDVPIFLPQDPGQAGKSQISFMIQELNEYQIKFTTMTGSKTDRASPLASKAEIGHVFLYRADWNEPFLEEVTSFPSGGHDDQVDAAACALGMFIDSTMGMFEFVRDEAARIASKDAEMRRLMGLSQATPR